MANNFGLFFTKGNTVIRLPVNPEKLPETRESDNKDYNILGIGQIVVPRTPKLRQVTISSFFPGRPFSGVLNSGKFKSPEFYISFFSSAMYEKKTILYTPVRYYENGESFLTSDTGFPALVSQFSTEERAAETGDFYYDLTLTEYRDYSPLRVQIQQNTTSETTATQEPTRSTPEGQLTVGSTCTANGPYYSSSYGNEPHGNGNGRRVIVQRIIDGTRPYPVHVTNESGGALGWMKKEALKVVV